MERRPGRLRATGSGGPAGAGGAAGSGAGSRVDRGMRCAADSTEAGTAM
ncbi:MAG TPA: hypothetical protein VFQ74_02855 [Pseudolysinimonas sp.]|nr:hypothetical protein [Pseudolysinimonas sp.]